MQFVTCRVDRTWAILTLERLQWAPPSYILIGHNIGTLANLKKKNNNIGCFSEICMYLEKFPYETWKIHTGWQL